MTRGPFTRGRSPPPTSSPSSRSFVGDISPRCTSLGRSAATSSALRCVVLRGGRVTRSPGEEGCSSKMRFCRGEVSFFGRSSTISSARTPSASRFSSPALFTVRFRAGRRTRSPSTRSPLLPVSASPLLGILFTSLSLSRSLSFLRTSYSPGLLATTSSITNSSLLGLPFRSSLANPLSFWGDGSRDDGPAAGTGTGTWPALRGTSAMGPDTTGLDPVPSWAR